MLGMNAPGYPDAMKATEVTAKPAQDSPSLWQRSIRPLVLSVALPIFVLAVAVEHWLPLEGRLALVLKLGMAGAIGVTVGLTMEKARDLWQQRREAEAAAGGSDS